MALFNECTQSCARIVLDMADIVRDGDFASIDRSQSTGRILHPHGSIQRIRSWSRKSSSHAVAIVGLGLLQSA
jgi:hypothetical protein